MKRISTFLQGVIHAADAPERRAVLQVVRKRGDLVLENEWGDRSPRTRIVAIGGFPSGTQYGCLGLSAGGVYNDQPTVTYTPLTGDRYIRSLMTPVRPEAVVFMIQSV